MKKAVILFILLITITIMLMSCNGQSKEIVTNTTPPQTYSDASQTINVSVNQEFILALSSNPTTGYSWQETHDAGLTLISSEYKQSEAPKDMVGVGGTEYFRFQATQKGETKVTLTYRRSWETPNPTDKTETFTISVK